MKLELLGLFKNKKYLIGVSGGSDSMMLLDVLFKDGYNIVVAHVNYKMRESADNDQKLVEEYCLQNKIPLKIKTRTEEVRGNFQSWARNYRYSFFKSVYHENNCDALLLAHHKNDYLETYLLQKERNTIVEKYGIALKTTIKTMEVIRPLINIYKEDIIKYIRENNINYGEDESNESLKYRRNYIRHNYLNKLSKKEMDNLYEESKKAQEKQSLFLKRLKELYKENVKNNSFSFKFFESLSSLEQRLFLYEYLKTNKLISPQKLTKKYLSNLSSSLLSDKPNLEFEFNDFKLIKAYDQISIVKNDVFEDYEYIIDALTPFKTPYFSFQDDKGESFEVLEEDFPLTIRNYRKGDTLVFLSYHKLLRRQFIDQKTPLNTRRQVPIVLNKQKQIIFIPHLYKYKDYNSLQSKRFVLKLKALT